jgi:two-component system response regulator FimZ (fimbrial Z protein)
MKPASVIIMDEHPIVRMSIEVLLQKNKNITVKLKSGDSHEVLDCIRNHPIDLVISLTLNSRARMLSLYLRESET